MKKIQSACAAIVVGALSLGTACAETPGPVYAGIGISYAKVSDQLATTAEQMMSTAGGTFSLDMKTSAASGRIFAGYNVHEQVALELGFLKTQNMRSNFTGTESHQISFSGSGTRKLSGIDYSVLLRPSQESGMHRFYGRLGGSYLQDDRSATVHAGTHSSYSVRASEKGTGWLAGIGYEHPVSSNLSIRAEYSHYGRIAGDSDTRAGMYGINLIGRF